MTRYIPKAAIEFTAAHEGLRLTAYYCPAGVLTIGYGSTGPHVKPGMTITKATALKLLRDDMQIAVRKLYGVLKPGVIDALTDNQYAALLSFAFNVGMKSSWGIVRQLNAGRLDMVPGELMKFTKANGKQLKGLVKRRAEEVALWNTPGADEEDEEVPSSAVLRQPGATPPVTDAKPAAKSGTFWTGAGVAASGLITAGQQVQALAAPQAAHSDLIANLASVAAVLIVAGGIAVMVFKWLDAKRARQ